MGAVMTKYHMVLLSAINRYAYNATSGAEIGVFKGETAKEMLIRLKGCDLYLVDPWCEWPEGSSYRESDLMGKRTQAEWDQIYDTAVANIGDNPKAHIQRMTSEEASRLHNDKSLDFVFIDANHTYEHVKRDIELWLPKTRRLIFGHDYGNYRDRTNLWGVRKAVDEIFGDKSILLERNIWAVEISRL